MRKQFRMVVLEGVGMPENCKEPVQFWLKLRKEIQKYYIYHWRRRRSTGGFGGELIEQGSGSRSDGMCASVTEEWRNRKVPSNSPSDKEPLFASNQVPLVKNFPLGTLKPVLNC
jgi:hypothetical protein